jgi:hypothetical protein
MGTALLSDHLSDNKVFLNTLFLPLGAIPTVAWCWAVSCSMRSECAAGRQAAVPWRSQIRHRQTTVSTDTITSMLITSVAERQTSALGEVPVIRCRPWWRHTGAGFGLGRVSRTPRRMPGLSGAHPAAARIASPTSTVGNRGRVV